VKSLADLFELASGVLKAAGVPSMLTGSIASSHYGAPRSTQDIDLVVEVDERQAVEVVSSFLRAGLYASEAAALEAVGVQGQFNVIDPTSGWKLDLICRKDRPFSRTEFERRQTTHVLGTETDVVSPEDLVIAKLEWAQLSKSDLQLRDVVAVLAALGGELDRGYIATWVAELGLEDEWVRVCSATGLE
jgi:hypothetical protein